MKSQSNTNTAHFQTKPSTVLIFNSILSFFLSLLLIASAYAQEIPETDDFPLDDSVSAYMESLEIYGAPELKDQALKKASLRPISPAIGNLNKKQPKGVSLGWTVSYALSMTLHLKPADAPSPFFIFDMLTVADCKLPAANYMMNLENILKFTGCPRASDYASNTRCRRPTNPEQYQPRYRAKLHKLLAASPDNGLHWNTVLFAIQRRLDEGTPVIGIMKADVAFQQLRNDTWQPIVTSDKLFNHAILIVGYDDQAQEIEVANCWGTNWGDGGFGRIKYRDLYRFRQLYYLTKAPAVQIVKKEKVEKPDTKLQAKPKNEAQQVVQKPVNAPTASVVTPAPSTLDLQGTLRLRIPIGQNQDGQVLFQDLAHTNQNGIYQNVQTTQWPVGQQFQLAVNQLTPESYFYLFSIDPEGKTSIHWPQKASLGNLVSTPYSAFVSDKNTTFMLPRPRLIQKGDQQVWQERAFTKDAAGTDYLVMLHAGEELPDDELRQIVQSLQGRHTTSELSDKLKAALGERFIAPPTAKQNAHSIHYAIHSTKGYVMPVVLKID
jgi:hypothetical protein